MTEVFQVGLKFYRSETVVFSIQCDESELEKKIADWVLENHPTAIIEWWGILSL